LKVAVIDDDAYDRKVICDSLIKDNYDVVEASDGISGLEIIEKENPDLIICDVRMPIMNGDQLLEIIRNSDNGMGIKPFIFISGFSDGQERIDRLKKGADNCFDKPVDLDLLSAFVKSNLSGAERISNYMKSHLDAIAEIISEKTDQSFNAYKSMTSTSIDTYVETIVNALEKLDNNEGIFSAEEGHPLSRLNYINFFLQEHQNRKLFVNTTNGEDLSWLLIFMVAKARINGDKIPVSDLYVTAPSAKSTVNARINSLIEEGIFTREHDIRDRRRQLISLSDSFVSDLNYHIDESMELIRERVS